MKAIYLDALQIHSNTSNLGYAVQSIAGLDFPEIRLASYNKPGESGAIVSNVLYGSRRITLTGIVFGNTVTLFEQRRRALEQALGIVRNTYSIPQAVTLKFQTMDDLQLQVPVYIKDLKIEVRQIHGMPFFIDLVAPDFALFSQSLNNQSVGIAGGGGAIYPVIYPVVYAAASGNSIIINNAGTVESYPVVYLNGPLTNPLIQNVTTGRYLELSLTLNSTDQIIIDMAARTIIKNGAQSVISNKTSGSQFWWLEKGNNTIKLLTQSGGDTGNGQIQWRDTYLGI